MELLNDFLVWAWDRHHNILSWYIRPLFVLPLAYASYRRSGWGIALTLVALATSMFSFPAPERPDPSVEEFLRMEAQFVTEPTPARVLTMLLAPLSLGALCAAFWRRSLAWTKRHRAGQGLVERGGGLRRRPGGDPACARRAPRLRRRRALRRPSGAPSGRPDGLRRRATQALDPSGVIVSLGQ